MQILFLVDGRSPIARGWMSNFLSDDEFQIHVVSSYPLDPQTYDQARSVHTIPLAFSNLAESNRQDSGPMGSSRLRNRLKQTTYEVATGIVQRWAGPLEILRHRSEFERLVEDIKPDIVHAMRIPFEGMLAAEAMRQLPTPLVVSVWGNDFTLHAERSPLVSKMTARCLARMDALHVDCRRDHILAINRGFKTLKPHLVVPGNGGIDLNLFRSKAGEEGLREELDIPFDAPVVLNPRGVRDYVRIDTFLRSIPLVLSKIPNVIFVAVGLARNLEAQELTRTLGLSTNVRLLGQTTTGQMADLFGIAALSVSPASHDGTPNTLLEAMASGAFPIAGDIEPLHEWIEHGRNGLLFDINDPRDLAEKVITALQDPELLSRSALENRQVAEEKADRNSVKERISAFYEAVAGRQH